MKENLKRRFPNQTMALGDWYRWTFRRRQEYGPELRYKTALDLAELKTADVVLEVGHCSYETLTIARRVHSVIVCNISGINRAVQARGPRNLRQVKGDVCDFPFEPDFFDAAFVIAVFEHIPDDAAAARNLYRALKPGGRLIVYVPDTAEHIAAWRRGEYPDHVRPGYTPEGMRALLEQAGFKVAHCQLENGVYSAVAGEVYYGLSRRMPLLYQLPHFLIRPFMALAARDKLREGSLRWGLFACALKPRN